MRKTLACGFLFLITFTVCFAEEEVRSLEPILVSKSKYHLLTSYAQDQTQLKTLPFNSPIEDLSFFPVDLQSRMLKDGIQTDFSLRGSTFQQVLIMLNGQRINDPQTAHHNSDIPITSADLEKIQVAPGAASAIFGPDALGGAINFQLKKPQKRELILEASGGRYDTYNSLFSFTEKKDIFGVRLSVEKQGSGGYRPDTDFQKLTSSFNSTMDLEHGEAHLNFGYQQKAFGAYDFYTPGSGYQSKEWTRAYLVDTGLNLEEGGILIKPNFLWRRHFDKFMLDKTQILSRSINNHRTDTILPTLYLQRKTALLGDLGIGTEYSQESIHSTNLGEHTRSRESIYLNNFKDLDSRLSYSLSMRWDNFDSFGQVASGAVNFKYKLNSQQALKAGVSRNTRIPSFTELYYNDSKTLGNSGLSSEQALSYEAGYEFAKDKTKAGLSLFLRDEDQMIDWVKRTHSQAKFQSDNISKAYVWGTEASAKLRLNQYIESETNYTYINRRLENSESLIYKYGQNYAKHLWNQLFYFDLPFGRQSFGFTFKKKPDRREWWLLDARLAYDLNKHSQVFLNVTNLLNVEYQEIEGIPSPGRWIEGGLRLEW